MLGSARRTATCPPTSRYVDKYRSLIEGELATSVEAAATAYRVAIRVKPNSLRSVLQLCRVPSAVLVCLDPVGSTDIGFARGPLGRNTAGRLIRLRSDDGVALLCCHVAVSGRTALRRMNPLTSRVAQRLSFARSPKYFPPDLLEVQHESFRWFLDEGLKEIFEEISPSRTSPVPRTRAHRPPFR